MLRDPRRVLMTTDAVGGVWEHALELSSGLGRRGIEVVLAAMGPPPDDRQQERARALGNIELVRGAFKLEWMEDPWDDVLLAGAWLSDLATERKVDLVHLNGYVH